MKLHPDVIVTDISMPKLDGIEAVDRLAGFWLLVKSRVLDSTIPTLISSPLGLKLVHSDTSIRLLWPPTCCSPSKKLSRDVFSSPPRNKVRPAQLGEKTWVDISQSPILHTTGGPLQPAAAIRTRSVFGESDASKASSAFVKVNCEKPQPKQTKTFGNSMTPDLSKFLRPPRCTIISPENFI